MFDIQAWLAEQKEYDANSIQLTTQVYLIKHHASGAWHKLKLASDPASQYLLSQEALWLRRSSNCQPVKYYLSQEYKGVPLLVMDFVEGVSLTEQLKQERDKLVPSKVMLSLFYFLNQLHEQGIIHNDVKPSNIILQNQEVCLIDFASAGWITQKFANKSYRAYTPVFALPEEYAFHSFAPIHDWYAYFLLLGLLETGKLLTLSDTSIMHFTDYYSELIVMYEFDIEIEEFLLNQIKTIG